LTTYKKKIRTLYMGHNPVLLLACLNYSNLIGIFIHEVNGNISQRAKSVNKTCLDNKISIYKFDKLTNAAVDQIKNIAPDLIIVGEYHLLLKNEIILIPPLGCINIHGSLLPQYKGAHPINWMLINGENTGGVTAHYVNEALDGGPIIQQLNYPIGKDTTAYDLRPFIEGCGYSLLASILQKLSQGVPILSTPQDKSKESYYPPRKPEDGQINWDQPSLSIHNFVRALSAPYPGAFTLVNNEKLIIWKTYLPEPDIFAKKPIENIEPGTICSKTNTELIIKTEDGKITVIDYDCAVDFQSGWRLQ